MKKKPIYIKWLLALSPMFLALISYFLLPRFPEFTEYFITRGLFRIICFPFQWIISFIPFSVTEVIVILALPILLALLIFWIIKIFRSHSRLRAVEGGLRFIAWCLSLALLIFMVADGANFSRLSAEELFELPDKSYTAEELYYVTCDLAKKASSAREKLTEDQNGCSTLSVTQSELLSLADDCYNNIKKDYPFLKTGVKKVKSVYLSHLWSYTGTTGVYCPWLSEANINTDVPDYELGHTIAHEVAHTMGFAKENECNFIAWLACNESDLPDFVYSGNLQAYVYCSNELYSANKELWLKAQQNCSKGMINDLRQSSAYWKQFEGEIEESSQKINDSFIKVNGVDSGVLSYNEMVELMLKFYDKTDVI